MCRISGSGRSNALCMLGSPDRLAAPSETPWYPRQREMIFFFSGRPSRLLYIRTSLICVSLASDPELP